MNGVTSLQDFSKKLRELPRTVAIKVAAAAAPALTNAAKATFASSQNAFGEDWVPGAEGQTVTLKESGTLASTIQYVAVGTKIRVALGTRYAKYQVGKRPIFPRQGDPLPEAYRDALESTTKAVLQQELGVR